MVLLLVVACLPTPALAQGTCNTASGRNNTSGLKKYKVNTSAASGIGFTTDEAIGATILAADVWNEQGNAGYFQYDGTTSLTTLPLSASDCILQGKYHSIVYFSNSGSSAPAQEQAFCGGMQSLITVFRYRADGTTEWDIGNGAADNTLDRDLVGTLAHEFGHSLGLAHPSGTEWATMRGGPSPGTERRELYEYDLKCLNEISGMRSATGYKAVQLTDGTFGGSSSFKSGVTKTHVGFSAAGSWGGAYHRGTAISWDQGIDGSYSNLTNPGVQNGMGFHTGYWTERGSSDRVFYSYWNDYPTQYGQTSNHLVRQIRSTNAFSSQTAGYLYHCNSMTGWMTCSTETALRSAGNLSTAYWTGGSRTVVAWSNQDRSSNSSSSNANQVRIAVGSVNDDRLSVYSTIPNDNGVARTRSAVPPGVACKNNFSGSYDCVVVYVPVDDLSLRIAARRFSISAGANNYTLTWDSTIRWFPSTSRTSGQVAVWWNGNTNRYYAAWRRATTGQGIGVRSSSDGITWTVDYTSYDTSYISPSAGNTYQGTTNILVYMK